MSYLSAPLSASEGARLFVERIEGIERYSSDREAMCNAVEYAVEAYSAPFFEAVRLAMVEVGSVSASDYRCVTETDYYYPSRLPDDFHERAAAVADIAERGGCLLAALKESIERQVGKAQTPQEVLSSLMLIVRTCEDVNLERLFG